MSGQAFGGPCLQNVEGLLFCLLLRQAVNTDPQNPSRTAEPCCCR